MEVLWQRGSGTVKQVLDWIPVPLAYNSVLTTVRILEKKRYVKHVKDGRAHVYHPVVRREDATRSAVRQLVGRFFRNSHEALLLNILQDDGIDATELQRLRRLVEESKER
jgi:predicted transcriptional regulator